MVDIAVVGNEVLLRGELPEAELLAYMRRVRAAVPAEVPVGCVDAYYQFLERPALVAACDVLLPNCYPFWEGADIDLAAQYLRRMHGLVKAAGGEDKPVIVTETGWPGGGQPWAWRCPRPTTRCATSSTCSNGAARGREAVLLLVLRRTLEAQAGRRGGHAVGPVGQGRAAQVRCLNARALARSHHDPATADLPPGARRHGLRTRRWPWQPPDGAHRPARQAGGLLRRQDAHHRLRAQQRAQLRHPPHRRGHAVQGAQPDPPPCSAAGTSCAPSATRASTSCRPASASARTSGTAARPTRCSRTSTSSRATHRVRGGAGRRPHLQDGLRGDAAAACGQPAPT
jgi:hypothetical protein